MKMYQAITCACLITGLLSGGYACNYGKYGLTPGDDSQATVDGLFSGKYESRKDYKTDDWRLEVESVAESATDIPGKLDYAWALYMSGERAKSVAIYQGILKTAPDNYETLCSYATVLHNIQQFPAAMDTLKKAIALKPGFRNRAEEFHLAMIDFDQKKARDYDYAREHIFVDALTPIWKNRKGTEQNLSTVEFPEGYTSEGMAELLRQYPHFGEAWMALGMLLEHEEDFSMAAKAYDRALERGTAHAAELRKYMKTFREFGRAHDPGRTMARGIVKLAIGLAGLVIFFFLFRISARVISDITGARAAKKKEEARRRRNDSNGPL